jgi:antitoxin HigA-1
MHNNYSVIGKNGKKIEIDVLLHPGEVLGDELEAREITRKDFAALINMQPPHLSDLIKGKRHISAKLALKLEKHLDIDAGFWLRLQNCYDLTIAKKELALEQA